MDLTADLQMDTTSDRLPSEVEHAILAHQDDLIGFLGLMQYFEIPLLPITWQPALHSLGKGATANVNQAAISAEISYAFKRMRSEHHFDKWVNEVMILGRLQHHPNIVSIKACCLEILESGKLFPVLVFKKAEYGDLGAFMLSETGRAMKDEDKLRLCAGIAEGLRRIHYSNIVHGDIKPQNILVFREPSGEIVAKIADFGHASMRATEDANINLPYSRFFNAPDYHPREIRLGDAKKFDSFNFGFLVYWLLVARKLMFEQKWAEENAFLASIQYQEDHILVAEKVLAGSDMSDEQMANLSFFFTHTLANHHQNRSADWDLFIALLTSQPRVNREQRDYETMAREDSDGDIREHSSPSLPHSNSNSNPELHPKFTLRHHIAYLATAEPYIRNEIILGLHKSYDTWQCEPCRRHNAFQVAICAFLGFGHPSDCYKYAVELDKSGCSLLELEREIDCIKEMWRDCDLQSLTNEFFAEYLSTSDYSMEYRGAKNIDLPLLKQLHMEEIKSCERVLGKRHGAIITLKRILALLLRLRSSYDEAADILIEALESVTDLMASIKIEMDLAVIYRAQGSVKPAERIAAKVFASLQDKIGAEHSYTLSAGSSLASTWSELGRLKEAEELLDQLVSVKVAKFGPEHPSTIETTAVLAAVYYNQKRFADAESLQIHILQVRKRTLGSEHEFTWTSKLNLAAIYTQQHRTKEAEDIELQVVDFRKERFGLKHQLTLTALSNLAMTFRSQKRWAEEEKALSQVVLGRIEVLGPEHPNTLTSIQALANNFLSQQLPQKAEPLLRKMVEARSRRSDYGPAHPSTLASRNSLAWTYFDQSKHVEAESMQLQTIAEGQKFLGESHQAVMHCRRHFARMLELSGRLEEARRVHHELWQTQVRKGGLTDSKAQQTAAKISELDELTKGLTAK